MKNLFLICVYLGFASCALVEETENRGGAKDAEIVKKEAQKDEQKLYQESLEKQITRFKKIYLESDMPFLTLSKESVIRLGYPVSDYIQNLAIYNWDTFEEIVAPNAPKLCGKSLLVLKSMKNRIEFLGKIKKNIADKKKVDRYAVTTGWGVASHLDGNLDIASFNFVTLESRIKKKELVEIFTKKYGYPTIIKEPGTKESLGWGVEHNNKKYFLFVKSVDVEVVKPKKAKVSIVNIVAYGKRTLSCKNKNK